MKKLYSIARDEQKSATRQRKIEYFSVNHPGPDDRTRPSTIADLMEQAIWHHQHSRPKEAEDICHEILARQPQHVHALNLLGLILQASGRHRAAVKALAKALASDASNAACQYNIGTSYQALNRPDEAAFHFQNAITLGAHQKNTEDLILQNAVISTCIGHIEEKWPLLTKPDELFGRAGLEQVANDIFLCCALQMVLIRGAPLEKYLTQVRRALLGYAYLGNLGMNAGALVDLFCALAVQCFINEYAFAQSDEEAQQSGHLRELLEQKIASGEEVAPLAAVAAYFPLHSLPVARSLMSRNWPEIVATLLRRQLR